ncbi:MAG: type 1 glutamine amidotransferase domain-containing protein [Ilumatobacteraceae bacterium]|nr:type 1 glutamine amidotransferase domain-containing protein [Ilumatobacteraceae bacterium]
MSKIAFVLADDFEDSEFGTPKAALIEAGHEVDVIGTETGVVTGKNGTEVSITTVVTDADPADYAALVIPGGFSPDHLRTDDDIVEFVKRMAARDVPVAAVCHAPSLLIEAELVNGRTMTSWPSIRTDLRNAGADVVDREVVVDGRFISSRNPDDLPAFSAAIIEQLRS